MRYKQVLVIAIMIIMSSIVLNAEINTPNNSSNQKGGNQDTGIEIPEKSDPFVPDPLSPHDGKSWNFTTDKIVGWRVTSDWGTRDKIFNISAQKQFTGAENVTGNNMPYYGVELTPAYWNVSQNKVMEFTNRTLFPLVNASVLNFDLPMFFGMHYYKMLPVGDKDDLLGPEYRINLFVPHNSSKVLDLFYAANYSRTYYSFHLNGAPPMHVSELVKMDINYATNSIHYSNPSLGTYCNLYYYDNGTLRTGEIRAVYPPSYFYTINWTRLYDFNPLDDLVWSSEFDSVGDVIYVGVDKNESMLEFNKTVDNLDIEIEWDDGDEEWDVDLNYYQEVWANVSFWNGASWEFENISVVGSANEFYPIVFSGDDDDNGDDNGPMPPFLVIPDEGTLYDVGDIFARWEQNPEWTDLTFDYGDNYVKITNTTTSNLVAFSYQADGILEYIYMSHIGPFEFENEDPYDEDLIWYYKNATMLSQAKPYIHNFTLYTFDLAISANINISLQQGLLFYYSGFPYNPTNRSINNALGFFDIFLTPQTFLDQSHFSPINITFYYDHTIYKSVAVYWFNISADKGRGAWEEIKTVKNLGNGVLIVTMNHTSIIVFTGSGIPGAAPPAKGDDDDDDDDEAPIIPTGNYYLIFLAMAVIGLVIYKKREIFKKI